MKSPQKNQTINSDYNHDFHTLNTHQRAFSKAHSKRTQRTFKKETCIRTSPTDYFSSLTSKGLQKRCERVDTAISTHALEEMMLPPQNARNLKRIRKEFNTLMNHPIF